MHQCRPEQISRLFQTAKSYRPRLVKLSVLIKILVQLSCGHSCTTQATSAQHLILVYFHPSSSEFSSKELDNVDCFVISIEVVIGSATDHFPEGSFQDDWRALQICVAEVKAK